MRYIGYAFLGLMVWFVVTTYQSEQAMNPADKLARACASETTAKIQAEEFLRRHLNLAKRPSFEARTSKEVVYHQTAPDGGCAFLVAGHITFENETGGTSRRLGRVGLGPVAPDGSSWRAYRVEVE